MGPLTMSCLRIWDSFQFQRKCKMMLVFSRMLPWLLLTPLQTVELFVGLVENRLSSQKLNSGQATKTSSRVAPFPWEQFEETIAVPGCWCQFSFKRKPPFQTNLSSQNRGNTWVLGNWCPQRWRGSKRVTFRFPLWRSGIHPKTTCCTRSLQIGWSRCCFGQMYPLREPLNTSTSCYALYIYI